MNTKHLGQNALLLLTAIIWGVAFVAQSVGMDYVGPFTFNSIRFLLGFVVLLPFVALETRREKKNAAPCANRKILWLGGLVCGAALSAASALQQIGLMELSAGKSGFITALYIVLVPVLGIFLKRKTTVFQWFAIALALVGMYLLCITGSFTIASPDLITLGCALLFAVQILCVDHFAPKLNPIHLACLQFLVAGGLCTVPMFLFEKPHMTSILGAWLPLLYAGCLSSGVAYTLQIVGQRGNNPTVASLIMSAESVISALAGWLILNQTLSTRELSGCVLVFTAIILTQIPRKIKHKTQHNTRIFF